MKNTGTLRIQAFAARQSSPVEGVTVTVSGNGFTATRLTDAEAAETFLPARHSKAESMKQISVSYPCRKDVRRKPVRSGSGGRA